MFTLQISISNNCDIYSFSNMSDPKQKKKTYKKCCKNWFKKNANNGICNYMKDNLKNIPEHKFKQDTSGFIMPKEQILPKERIQPKPRKLGEDSENIPLKPNYSVDETPLSSPQSDDKFDPGEF